MVNAFLTPSANDVPNTERFVKDLITGDGARGSGGFTLVCGRLGERLAVVSNRMQEEGEVKWMGAREGETVGLSNAAFGDRTWEKVVKGEQMMEGCVKKLAERDATKEEIIRDLMQLLSVDTLPRLQEGGPWERIVKSLRESIFIPRLGPTEDVQGRDTMAADEHRETTFEEAMTGAYGTQKQTVVLVDGTGNVTFVERTLYDEWGRDVSNRPDSTRTFEFNIGKQALG